MAKKEIDEKEKTKLEMLDYLKEQVNIEVSSAVKKAENRLLKHKNVVILKKNIIIILLLLIIFAIIIYLYKDNYFAKYLTNSNAKVNSLNETDEIENVDLNELYSYLLDNIVISENSKYLQDFYEGKLTDNIKNYLALGLVLESDFENEDEVLLLSEETFLGYYNKLFLENCKIAGFDYNNSNIKYLKSQNIFLIDNLNLDKKSNIKRSILNIVQENDVIKITTVEALVKDEYIYNILNNKKIGKYDNNLEKYKDKLNILTYTFESEKLISLSKS